MTPQKGRKTKHVSLGFLVFLSLLPVYLKHSAPLVFVGDSGELETAAAGLGIPHNPGYPLYVLSAHLLTSLPFGNLAYRANLFSGIAAALACGFLAAFLRRLGFGAAWGAMGAWAFGLTFTFWSQAEAAEVYAPYVAFLTAVLWTTQRLKKGSGNQRLLLALYFLCALALVAHLSFITVLPGILWLGWRRLSGTGVSACDGSLALWERVRVREHGSHQWHRLWLSGSAALIFILLAGSLFLMLPLRAIRDPAMNWSHPATFFRLKHHLLAEEHRAKAVRFDLERLLDRTVEAGGLWKDQWGWIGLALAAGGIILSWRRFPWGPLGLIFLGDTFYTLFLNTTPITATGFGYAGTIVLGTGILAALREGAERLRQLALGLGAAAILGLWLFTANLWYTQARNHTAAFDYGHSVLRLLKPGECLLATGDNQSFIFQYLQSMEGVRPDVMLLSGGRFRGDRSGRAIAEPACTDDARVVYASSPAKEEINGLTARPWGLAYRYLPKDTPPPASLFDQVVFRGFEGRSQYFELLSKELVGNFWSAYAKFLEEQGRNGEAAAAYAKASELAPDVHFVRFKVGRALEDRKEYEAALREYRAAAGAWPNFDAAWYRIGVIQRALGRTTEAEDAFRTTVRLNPANAAAWNFLGELAYRQRRAQEAFDAWTAAVKGDPTFSQAYSNLGAWHYARQEFAEARNFFRKAVDLDSANSQAWKNLGAVAFYQFKDVAEARKAWEKFLALEPQSPEAPLIRKLLGQ